MLKHRYFRVFAGFTIAFVYYSCNHFDQLTVNNSSHNTSKSHNVGLNCMTCHKKGGGGQGWFYAAGTAFHSNNSGAKNVTVKLFSEPNGGGNLVKEIPGDLLGNFYTTDIMSFGTGLFPVVEYNGVQSFMSSSITIGACNSCHGISTAKITID
jgi:hypothetical protein